MEKLNRASRLLLGALVEAYDVLQQLQAECGDTVQDQASQASLARVRQFVNTTQPPVTPQPQQQSLQQQQQSQPQQSEQEHNELSAVATAATSNNIIATTETMEDTPMDETIDTTKDITKDDTKDTTEEDTGDDTHAADTPDHHSCVAPAKAQGLPDIVTSHALLTPPRAKAPPPPSLPDVVADSLHALGRRMSPRKVARRRVFRLSTLRELHQQRQPAPSTPPSSDNTTPPPLSWAEAGQKLASIATTLDTSSPSQSPRRRSLPALMGRDDPDGEERRRGRRMSQVVAWHADTGPKMETDKIINNVLKAVQVFGLFLIIRKFENMLK